MREVSSKSRSIWVTAGTPENTTHQGVVFSGVETELLQFRACCEAGDMIFFSFPREENSRGEVDECLVESARSARLYLATRDHEVCHISRA